jgi:hypothetical protein
MTRTRECSTGFSSDCVGLSSEEIECLVEDCPEFVEWQEWSACSKSCAGGQKSRRRYCSSGDLNDCTGESFETESCNETECPTYGLWSFWSGCSKSCGGGNQYRSRMCSSGIDSDCPGFRSEMQKCSQNLCPVWNLWQDWESCSVTCSRGTRNRFRGCSTGLLVDCFGDSIKQEFCYAGSCPTAAPKTITALPLEENRLQIESSKFAPTPVSNFLNVKVEEFGKGESLHNSALNGFQQFGGANAEDNSFGRKKSQVSEYESDEYAEYYYNDYDKSANTQVKELNIHNN